MKEIQKLLKEIRDKVGIILTLELDPDMVGVWVKVEGRSHSEFVMNVPVETIESYLDQLIYDTLGFAREQGSHPDTPVDPGS